MARYTDSDQVPKAEAVTAIRVAGILLLVMVYVQESGDAGVLASNTNGSPTLGVTSRRMRRLPLRDAWKRRGRRGKRQRN